MNTSRRLSKSEAQLLQSLRGLSSPERDFIRRAIDALAYQRATREQAPEGGNPQNLTNH